MWGGKQESSQPSLLGMAAGVVDMQPAAGISFSRMGANQASCPSTLQATKSSSLTVRTVQVEGASLLCDMARGITRPLVSLVDRGAIFHAIHSVAHPRDTHHKKHDGCTLCLESQGKRPGSHVPRLPAVPARESSQATGSSSPCHPNSSMQVLLRTLGPGGLSADLI
jgi:hypothetical protein